MKNILLCSCVHIYYTILCLSIAALLITASVINSPPPHPASDDFDDISGQNRKEKIYNFIDAIGGCKFISTHTSKVGNIYPYSCIVKLLIMTK